MMKDRPIKPERNTRRALAVTGSPDQARQAAQKGLAAFSGGKLPERPLEKSGRVGHLNIDRSASQAHGLQNQSQIGEVNR